MPSSLFICSFALVQRKNDTPITVPETFSHPPPCPTPAFQLQKHSPTKIKVFSFLYLKKKCPKEPKIAFLLYLIWAGGKPPARHFTPHQKSGHSNQGVGVIIRRSLDTEGDCKIGGGTLFLPLIRLQGTLRADDDADCTSK